MSKDEVITAKASDLAATVSPEIREMVDAGVFYGRSKSRTHPRMKRFILNNRNGIEVIDLDKTKELLDKAVEVITSKVADGGSVLFVATQPAAHEAVQMAEEFGYPVVSSRWLGGTLTNFKIISGRVDYYKKLKADFEKGALEKYTKKERLMIERELENLKETMGGLENLVSRPAVVVVIDSNLHLTAVKEARHLNIPIVAFVNTDSDPDLINYPVLGNNKARTAISWFLGHVKKAITDGRKLNLAKAEASKAPQPQEEK